MGSFGQKSQQSTGNTSGTSTTTLSPEVKTAYDKLLGNVGGLSSGTNAATNAATTGLGTLANTPNAGFTSAAGTLGSAAAPAYTQIGNYMSPFITNALNAQVANQNEQNAEQQQGVIGNAAAKGALGGNRVSVAQGELQRQNDIANNAANANLLNTGYQQAVSGAIGGQQAQTGAGAAQTGLGSSTNTAYLSDLLGQLSGGSSQFGNLGTLGGVASGLSNSGATVSSTGTSTSTQPQGNIFSQLLGGALSLGSLWPHADGGVVHGYEAGGVVPHLATGGPADFSDMGAALAAALSGSSALAQQQPPQAANDTSAIGSGVGTKDQQKVGLDNIKSWFMPKPMMGGELGGFGSSYAHGGVVPRGYDAGGYVMPGSNAAFASDIGDWLSNTFNPQPTRAPIVAPVAPNNPSSAVTAIKQDAINNPPSAPSSSVVPSSNVVPFAPPQKSFAPYGARMYDISTMMGAPPVNNGDPSYRALATPDVENSVAARHVLTGSNAPPTPAPLPPLPQQGGVVPQLPAGGPMARSDRNNNPGNITMSSWTAKQPGVVGTDGPFATFATPEDGRNAQISLLSNYASSGNNTIAGMVSKWAPQSANAPGSTGNYIAYVAQRTGIDPSQPVPPGALPAVADAMSEFESGHRGSSSTPSSAPQGGSTSGVVPPGNMTAQAGPSFNSGASGVIPNPGYNSQPGGGIPGGLGVTPPGGYGIPDTNAGYSTNIGDSLKSLFAGHGLNLSPDARSALLSAGAGMMAGTSGVAGVNIGTGIQAGQDQWMKKQELNRENALANSSIGAEQGNLGIAGQQLYLNAKKTAADVARTGVETAGEATTFAPSGLGMIEKTINPDGTVSISRLPLTSIPMAGSQPGDGSTTGEGQAPAASGVGADNVPTLGPNDIPAYAYTDSGLADLRTQGHQLTDPAIAAATSARGLNVSLSQMADLAKNLPSSGPFVQGAGFGDRIGLMNAINTTLGAAGIAPIDPSSLATAEGFKKIATQLQFAVADSVKSDPAAATIAQAASASPSGENTPQGVRDIIGNLMALNQRAQDRASYLTEWQNRNQGVMSGKSGTADDYFNKYYPAAEYVAAGKAVADTLNGKVPMVKSQIVYSALPSGSVYLAPDNKQHQKQ